MTVGKSVTRTDADQAIGIMVQSLFHAYLITDQVTDWWGGMTGPEITALYPESGEATLAGNMIADAQQSLQVFRGQAALAVAKNFRTNMKKGLGTGLF